jgi:hypothetical protein
MEDCSDPSCISGPRRPVVVVVVVLLLVEEDDDDDVDPSPEKGDGIIRRGTILGRI